MNFLTHISDLVLRSEQDCEVAGALADPRRPAHRAGSEAPDRRTLVSVDRLHIQILAHELVVVLSVGHRRLEQLAPVASDRTRGVSEDSSRFLNALSADVLAHEAGLPGGRAHVLRLRPDDDIAPLTGAPSPTRRGRRGGGRWRGLLLGGLRLRPPFPPRPRLWPPP